MCTFSCFGFLDALKKETKCITFNNTKPTEKTQKRVNFLLSRNQSPITRIHHVCTAIWLMVVVNNYTIIVPHEHYLCAFLCAFPTWRTIRSGFANPSVSAAILLVPPSPRVILCEITGRCCSPCLSLHPPPQADTSNKTKTKKIAFRLTVSNCLANLVG